MWQIFAQLRSTISDTLPKYLTIVIPDLDNATIKLDLPQLGDRGIESSEDVLRRMGRREVLDVCEGVLEGVPGWEEFKTGKGMFEGMGERRLGLAWRKGDRLDWVALDWDVRGEQRLWGLLSGAGPLRQVSRSRNLVCV
jgi:hypothetical protein